MKIRIKTFLMLTALAFSTGEASAQLSTNPDKFLGNITTGWNSDMDTNGFIFADYWNQVTCENATKWGSVEGTRGKYNWTGADKAAKYAAKHNFPFKFHTFVWGSQFPDWLNNLSVEKRYEAIEKWMDATKEHFPDLKIIDVVNEAIEGHQAQTGVIKAALGGDGVTGYDWIIKAFEMAYERWPDAILIYNDFNTFQWNTDQFIDLVKTLRDAGAPIDAYGCQSHDLTDISLSNFKKAMDKLQDALKMPMYSTEYDIGTSDDNLQLKQYKDQIPYMWEKDYCAGITLWGWIYGSTWTTDGNSGLIKNKKKRPALEWLEEYMASDAAKNAKSPFPGMVKEASIYIKPSAIRVNKEDMVNVNVTAKLLTKTISSVDFYVNNELRVSTTEQPPYKYQVKAEETGRYDLKVVVKTTDGTTYERYGGFDVFPPREPYNGIAQLPGVLEVEDFDSGAEGMSYHDSDTKDEGDAKYRKDNGGVDLVKGNGGVALGYTASGEWLEYTIDVNETGEYSYEAIVSSGNDGSGFIVSLADNGTLTQLFKVSVPKTGDNNWNNYKSVTGKLSKPLEKGRHNLRLTIDGGYCNIDKIIFECTSSSGISDIKTDNANAPVYNLMGVKVGPEYKGVVVKNGKKFLQ